MNESSDKRKFSRYGFQKQVKVFPVLPSKSGNIYEVQKNPLEVRSANISEGGVRLETDQALDPAFLLKLNFELEKDQLIEVYGQVIWSSKNQCGVRFMLTDSVLRKGIRAIAQKNRPSAN